MADNTFDTTVKCCERLHRVVCPKCPNMSEEFKEKWCLICTRTIGYGVFEGLNKRPWLKA
jgi:hypothetical protein